ncbi:MAG: hypothetical protein LBK69_07855 [Syntrophomonadaceae bacterium]|jgi:hypothetical protein|nr:hypothetical protein [Syntrophomonadaceae bacterium]
MDFTEARMQISDLLEEYRPEWNDVLEEYFPEAYWVDDIQIYPDESYIWIDRPSMTFTFKDITLGFDLQMWSHTDAGMIEHGECLSSGKGKIIYSGGKILNINDMEIDLYRQSIIKPRYNSGGQYCWNIANVLKGLKKVYPYPDDNKLSDWAGVTISTIKRWHDPKAHANSNAVEQLMDSFNSSENVAGILL